MKEIGLTKVEVKRSRLRAINTGWWVRERFWEQEHQDEKEGEWVEEDISEREEGFGVGVAWEEDRG